MTTSRTPSQRGASNRRKGHTAERDLCRWLRANGFPGAERAVRTGFRVGDRVSADPGDVTGTPGIVWSVKDCAVEEITKWLAELERMRADDNAPLGLLVHKRRGHADPARWWCWMPLDVALWLVSGSSRSEDTYRVPMRMELGHVVALLRVTGYGDPVEAAS